MDKNQLLIPENIYIHLLQNAQSSSNKEICGLIGIKQEICTTCYPIQNISKTPKKSFQLDTKQHINAFSNMRKNNEKEFAIYHSHPTTDAFPSSMDIELATYPEAVYLIISLQSTPTIRGYAINDKTIREIDLIIGTN